MTSKHTGDMKKIKQIKKENCICSPIKDCAYHSIMRREQVQKDVFYNAWYFIEMHPKFMELIDEETIQTFPYGLDIQVVKVNPDTMRIDDDESKNTKVQIWLEHGPYEQDEMLDDTGNVTFSPTHDIDLDCGADTFEEAIIELARLIKKKYGDY